MVSQNAVENCQFHPLKVFCLNVCGLISKLKAYDLEEKCQCYDILCFSESKLDEYDDVQIANFVNLPPLNRKGAKIKSGGIIVFVKNELFENIEVLNGSSDNALWFVVKNICYDPILFGSIYIPPENSDYSDINFFDVIQEDILKHTTEKDYKVCLLGDFNARTGTKEDFVNLDDFVCNATQLDDKNKQDFDLSNLGRLGIDCNRYNYDKFVNNYGNRLLQLCKDLNLLIANGRVGQDKQKGSFTCKESSTIDYCILSPVLFTSIVNFEICSFDSMLSDVHNALYIELLCKTRESIIENFEDVTQVKKSKWKNENCQLFYSALCDDDIITLIEKLNIIDIDTVNNDVVNNLVEECSNIIRNAAVDSDLLSDCKKIKDNGNKRFKVNKPWYNKECYDKRKKYYKARNLNWRIRTAESKSNLVQCSKDYKKVLSKQYNVYQKNFIKKIRGLRQNDSKSYWALLNKACNNSEKQKIVNKVSLECFLEHFKKLNTVNVENEQNDMFEDIDSNDVTNMNTEINAIITEKDVLDAVKCLKNNKACSTDMILNEFLKHSCDKLLPVFVKLFNVIFDSGIIPDSWSEGIIIPIYKNKGDPCSPDNYRGITILSCFGKLFTTILNNRLNCYLQNYNVLCEEQAGFRKHYSTCDHIFNLKCLIDLYSRCNKTLYCAFIDYRKAFDSVDRLALWHKLLSNCIDGKMFKIIHNMYANAKSCVRQGVELSDSFYSNVGVRQGENLSPVLFSLFLNDLVEFISHAYDGLSNIYNAAHIFLDTDELSVYLKLYMLLYADDTVILAESQNELQAALNAMYLYCKTWKLEVNASKTKIVIFRKKNSNVNNINVVFTFNGEVLDIVDDFIYLGTVFMSNGSFCKNKSKLVNQGRKAMYSILRKSRKLNLPIDIQLELFDTMVVPVLLYGCEVWGFNNNDIFESFCVQFYKQILGLKKSTPNCILYGELGRFPIDIVIKSRMIAFWKRIICNKQDKICAILYKLLYNMHMEHFFHSKWLTCIENTLNSCGLSEFWLSQNVPHNLALSHMVKQRLCDQFKQSWCEKVFDSAKCLNYRIFKCSHNFEKYLIELPFDLRKAFCNYRCLNHRLPVEQGRFWGVDRDDRICDICNMNSIGDEFHYIFECKFFNEERKQFLPQDFMKKPNAVKFHSLFNVDDYSTKVKIAKFCKIILSVIN